MNSEVLVFPGQKQPNYPLRRAGAAAVAVATIAGGVFIAERGIDVIKGTECDSTKVTDVVVGSDIGYNTAWGIASQLNPHANTADVVAEAQALNPHINLGKLANGQHIVMFNNSCK